MNGRVVNVQSVDATTQGLIYIILTSRGSVAGAEQRWMKGENNEYLTNYPCNYRNYNGHYDYRRVRYGQ